MIKLLFLLLPVISLADTDVFKREIDFVVSQRQTLEKQLVQVKSQRIKQNSDLDRQLEVLHQEKARLAAELEGAENEASEFSRLAKKQTQSESALSDRLSWVKTKNEEMSYFAPYPIKAENESLTAVLAQQSELLASLSQVFTAEKAYTDTNQSLHTGSVFHLGPFARFLNKDNQWNVLTLAETGYYTTTHNEGFDASSTQSPFIAAAFVQLPFSKIQPILKEKNMFNRILDSLPGVFLALVFLAIGWIFLQLAKS